MKWNHGNRQFSRPLKAIQERVFRFHYLRLYPPMIEQSSARQMYSHRGLTLSNFQRTAICHQLSRAKYKDL